jgi:hypothetical protein
LTKFVEKSYPIVFIACCEIFAEKYEKGINCARLAYVPGLGFLNVNQEAKSLQFVILSCQGDAKHRPRTGKQFSSDGTGRTPMIKGEKGADIWFSDADRYAVRPFPEM